MPTVITHAAVLLCIGLGLGSKAIPPRLLFAGIVLAMLPDADVLSFLTATFLVIADLPIRWCLRLLSRCYVC